MLLRKYYTKIYAQEIQEKRLRFLDPNKQNLEKKIKGVDKK